MKTITSPSGKSIRFGRLDPVATGPRLRLCRYLDSRKLREDVLIPDGITWGTYADRALAEVYCNDELGSCVVSAAYHIVGVETSAALGEGAGSGFLATSAEVIADYSAIGGYVPGRPETDLGCDEVTAFNYYLARGFADGSRLEAWIAIDATKRREVTAALYLFENLFLGMSLPDAWIEPFPETSGFVWDVAGDPNPENGHAVMGYGYDERGVQIGTWGMTGTITWAALAKYATRANGGELYSLLLEDQVAKGAAKAPNGVAWTQLVLDWNAMGGNIPVPSPVPPSPSPTPAGARIAIAKQLLSLVETDATGESAVLRGALSAYLATITAR